jgi:hypothetical protein
MDLILSQEVHWQIINSIRQILQGAVGTVRGRDNLLGLLRAKFRVHLRLKLGFVFLRWRQVTLHGPDKGPSAQCYMLEIICTLFGTNASIVVEGIGHTNKITGMIYVHTPVLTGLVPALIGGIGTEDFPEVRGMSLENMNNSGEWRHDIYMECTQ